ncbi:MAG TPA: response regulator transcription factor [Ktedonobacterales bacterium]|nr:response regulator transcription factor [Ktedonobacterales bacterium]
MATIVVVEDELDICNLIRAQLEGDGHAVYQAFDGPTGLAEIAQRNPDLIILDWMLPSKDGLTLCREVRQQRLTPIIMLTARSQELDRVLGLEVGADDYVVKPFSVRELQARVRSLLRRVELDRLSNTAAAVGTTIVSGPLRIEMENHSATLDGAELDLTPIEFELLALLVRHPGRAFSREFLLERIWGYSYDGADRTVDTHITRLRKKLGALGEKIVTVWSVGYRFIA